MEAPTCTIDIETDDLNDTGERSIAIAQNSRYHELYGRMNRQQRRAQMARERRAARR